MPPTLRNGKICYIEIPATDISRSAEFYSRVFGWQIRQRGDGATAFDDGVGEVSGAWVLDRPPAAQPGFMIYVMVDSVAATIEFSRTAARSFSPSAPMRRRSQLVSAIQVEMLSASTRNPQDKLPAHRQDLVPATPVHGLFRMQNNFKQQQADGRINQVISSQQLDP